MLSVYRGYDTIRYDTSSHNMISRFLIGADARVAGDGNSPGTPSESTALRGRGGGGGIRRTAMGRAGV